MAYILYIYDIIPPKQIAFLPLQNDLCFPNTAGTAGGTATAGRAAAAVAREALPGATEFRSSWNQGNSCRVHIRSNGIPTFHFDFFWGWGYYRRHLVYVCVGYEYVHIYIMLIDLVMM